MRSITEIKDFEGKRVLVRVDWDVLVEGGIVVDTERVDAGIPTIEYILKNNGSVVLLSHFGRKGESNRPVYEYFNKKIPAIYIEDPFSHEGREDINNLKVAEVAVVENLRRWPEEEKNDESFAKSLASLGEIYVNDSFAASHRAHASVVGISKFLPHYAGFRFMKEIDGLSKVFNPEHPFLFILGGAKLETKLPLLKKFLSIADRVFVGGILAAEADLLPEIKENEKVFFPHGDIKAQDVDQETLNMLRKEAEKAKFIVWNGPLGNYEKNYTFGTEGLAQILADVADKNGTEVIVGGGDTLTAIKNLDLASHFTHISLAGGAMLDFLADGKLPAIEALN